MAIESTFRRQFAADTLVDLEVSTSVVSHENLNAPRNRTIAALARRHRRAIFAISIVIIITIIIAIVSSLATGESGNGVEETTNQKVPLSGKLDVKFCIVWFIIKFGFFFT